MYTPLYAFSDVGFLLLRIALAAVFIVHGWPKIIGFKRTAGWFDSIKIKPGIFWALVVSVVEFFGGFSVLLGVFTQIVGLLLAIIMLVAILAVKRKSKFSGGWEFDFVLLLVALALVFLGSGTFSLEQYFGWRIIW